MLNGDEGYEYVARIEEDSLAYNLFSLQIVGDELTVLFSIKPKNGLRFPYGRLVEPD